MKRIYPALYVAVLFSLISISVASSSTGQQPRLVSTPPATATLGTPGDPYDSLLTPQPTLDLACPSGTPQGWGTVTPGAAWEFLCAQCWGTPVVETPDFSLIFPTPTATECVGCTPAPTSTVTLTPTTAPTSTGNQIDCVGGTSGVQCLVDTDNYIQMRLDVTCSSSCGGGPLYDVRYVIYPKTLNRPVALRAWVYAEERSNYSANAIDNSFSVKKDIGTSYYDQSSWMTAGPGTVLTDENSLGFDSPFYYMSGTANYSYYRVRLLGDSDWPTTYLHHIILLEVMVDVYEFPSAPTPTPGPTQSYCYAVVPEQSQGVQIPLPVYLDRSQTACVTTPEISLENFATTLLAFFGLEISQELADFLANFPYLPASTLCAVPVKASTIDVLGFQISMVLLIDLVAYAFLLGMLFSRRKR